MKTKTFLLTTLMFAFLLTSTTGIHAQTAKSNLDQAKLMQQMLGTWEATVGKDTVEVWETKQYGKSFITKVSRKIKGEKSPYYISNDCFDSKDGNIKGFLLMASGDYNTWIGSWTSEKKLSAGMVQNFKPETVSEKYEFVYETPAKMTFTVFNIDGKKTWETKYIKVK